MTKRRFNMDDMMDDVSAYIETPKESPVQNVPVAGPVVTEEAASVDYNEPKWEFRRTVTLSECLFRRLELVKKSKNRDRKKGEGKVTLDKLMFDMIQHCLDTQYPETKEMFEKYIKLNEMGMGEFM